ncbi:MAG: ATP synthase F0 subunit C [Clostridia bacterium]|nr:ATP synthase F0 subunit C [Clostridia bacterium]
MKKFVFLVALITLIAALAIPAFAAEAEAPTAEQEVKTEQTAVDNTKTHKAYAAGICVALTAIAGALGMAIAIGKSNESTARQPEASGAIRSNMMLGLVFIETAIIYALIVGILIIFVL